jgi:hypothetical protein
VLPKKKKKKNWNGNIILFKKWMTERNAKIIRVFGFFFNQILFHVGAMKKRLFRISFNNIVEGVGFSHGL